MDISETTQAKSDQQNYDDYAGGIVRTVTVAEVRKGSSEQPVEIHLVEFPGKPFKPAKTVRRLLVAAWGKDSSVYVGRRMTLYGDPTVKWAGQAVGGIRVSHLSDIDKPLKVMLSESKGKRVPVTVQPLPDAPTPQADPIAEAKTRLWNAWTSFNEPDAAALTAAFNEATGTDLSTATPEQMHEYADTLTTGDTTEETP